MVFGRFHLRMAGIAASAALLSGSLSVMPAQAAEDTNTFNSFLGFFGMQFDKEQEDSIDYRARAPLVVPPKLDLPPPQSADARHPADWPTDPDVYARRKAQADSHRPAPQITPNTRPEMTKDQLLANRGETVVDETPSDSSCSALGGSSLCAGSAWKYVTEKMGISKKEDEKVVLSGSEPPRKYLTEPPPGYRVPTANTKVVADKVKSEPDSGDAQAYIRNEQTRKHSVDE